MTDGTAPDTRFSKMRLEMLCDGIFAIAMTLLVLELKVPDLPKGTPIPEIWHALREHGLSFFGFALTFLLAGQIWIAHHRARLAVAASWIVLNAVTQRVQKFRAARTSAR